MRHRIADLATELECARPLTYEVAERLECGNDPVTTRMTSMAKIKTAEVDMESHVRHSRVLPIYAGTNEIQREIISGSLGRR